MTSQQKDVLVVTLEMHMFSLGSLRLQLSITSEINFLIVFFKLNIHCQMRLLWKFSLQYSYIFKTRRKKIILRAKIMRTEGQTLNRIEVLGVKALRKPINLLTL